MHNKRKTYFNWSSGKDASLALYLLQQDPTYHIDTLVTTVNQHHDRVTMHGLRRELLVKQAEAIGLPLRTIELPREPSMEEYNTRLQKTVFQLKEEGYSHCGFGDIFLEDLRMYREEQLKPYGIQACFPLWKKDTKVLIQEFLDLGFKAKIVCLKAELLDVTFLGRDIDTSFVNDLPPNVDPCGENGEFHTFCYDGPIFQYPINIEEGEKVFREYKRPRDEKEAPNSGAMGFWFNDFTLME